MQHNATSREASGTIARAPRLSCLYKQALIFLSSSGTSAIYSQLCGRGAQGVGEILLQSSQGPGGLCVRIDFTCKRGKGPELLNKGKALSPEGRRVKTRWMDNNTGEGG